MSYQVASSTSLHPASDVEKLKRPRCEVSKLERLLEFHKAQTEAIAELALKRYNMKDELVVKYTIDTALNSNGFLFNDVDIIHANFTAKKQGDSDDSCPSDMFFAEITCNLDGELEVWTCVIVDPKENDGEKTRNHCNYCSERFQPPIYHAVDHCRFGYYDEDHFSYINYHSDSDESC
ncbi:hypothetical protein LINGRAHAP2_LOCUS25770 [Linum grandiflorum]